MRERVEAKFKEVFGTDEGSVYASPGRVNLIGEHTDYNGGFVLPGAIDKGVMLKIRPNGTDKANVYAIDMDQMVTYPVIESEKPAPGWSHYVYGVNCEMQKVGAKLEGYDAVFAGDVPLGAGLSSSAALESAFAFALNDMFGCGLDKKVLVKVGQMTEHNYCGTKCGIMDQFASVFGKEGCLIKLDCSTMDYEYIPFHPKGYRVVLVDSKVKHELVDSPYNRRRESCERVVAEIAKTHPEVKLLADADFAMLEQVKDAVSQEDYMRATYVIGENNRLATTCAALQKDDYETVGEMVFATHQGLSKLYEVSTPEIDFLNELAKGAGVTGSRIMGGGFGGCTINIVKDELYDAFIDQVFSQYEAKFGVAPAVYDVKISNGARKLN